MLIYSCRIRDVVWPILYKSHDFANCFRIMNIDLFVLITALSLVHAVHLYRVKN